MRSLVVVLALVVGGLWVLQYISDRAVLTRCINGMMEAASGGAWPFAFSEARRALGEIEDARRAEIVSQQSVPMGDGTIVTSFVYELDGNRHSFRCAF